MSSGFVSGGTADNPTERDEEWKRAALDLEKARIAKEDAAKQHDGKSLFEVLQANKEKKQAEFEERARFKLHNALDDDEADYLEGLLEKKRQEEASVRKETSEQLDLFRRQQEEAESRALEAEAAQNPVQEDEQWAAAGRKRKKGLEGGLLKGVKLRKASAMKDDKHAEKTTAEAVSTKFDTTKISTSKPGAEMKPATATKTAAGLPKAESTNTLSLGLGYASSDEDD
ncbi:hypothetical protein ACN47E_002494 [Coniothyrium glycines]